MFLAVQHERAPRSYQYRRTESLFERWPYAIPNADTLRLSLLSNPWSFPTLTMVPRTNMLGFASNSNTWMTPASGGRFQETASQIVRPTKPISVFASNVNNEKLSVPATKFEADSSLNQKGNPEI